MTVYLHSLGCDKNLTDSEVMLGLLFEKGYKSVSEPSEADMIIVNTCGFIKEAVEESIETILEMASYKNDTIGRCKSLVVTGCMAQRYKSDILTEIPEVDKILGVNDYPKITGKNFDIFDDELLKKRVNTMPVHVANVKISEGCDNCCAYCTIPSIRGPYREREFESIINECKMLVKNGAKELVMIAQDTAIYGMQLYKRQRLHELLDEISKIDGVCWVRVMYTYPEHIYGGLIETIAENKKICNYLDMPVQHSHEDVIKRMGRVAADIKKIISQLKERDIAVRTTLITGFPGESTDEFEHLCNFVKESEFDRLGVFVYSREEGTPAAKMKPQIKSSVKKARQQKIMEIQADIVERHNKELMGETLKIMVDGSILDDNEVVYCGRSEKHAYDVDGTVFFTVPEDFAELMSGDAVYVKITQNHGYDVYGELVDTVEV